MSSSAWTQSDGHGERTHTRLGGGNGCAAEGRPERAEGESEDMGEHTCERPRAEAAPIGLLVKQARMRSSGMHAPPARLSTTGAARLPEGPPRRPGWSVRLRHTCVKRGWALERRTWRRGPNLPQDRSKMRQTPAKESETPSSLKQSQTGIAPLPHKFRGTYCTMYRIGAGGRQGPACWFQQTAPRALIHWSIRKPRRPLGTSMSGPAPLPAGPVVQLPPVTSSSSPELPQVTLRGEPLRRWRLLVLLGQPGGGRLRGVRRR